jgi:hypothetical protein
MREEGQVRRLLEEAAAHSELRRRSDRELARLLVESDLYGRADHITVALLSEIICRLLRADGPPPPDWNESHAYLEAFGDGCGHCGEAREHELHQMEVRN